MLAIAALYVSRCKAFMFESPMTCYCINQRRRFKIASSAITSTSATSYHPQSKRLRKVTRNRQTKNYATEREVEENEVAEEKDADEHHRTISSARPNNAILRRTNRNEELFQKRLTELQDFRLNHGHGSIPSPYPSNPSLGIWAANVRQQYSLWKHAEERGYPYIGYLTQSRRQLLQLAGFDFVSLTERQFRIRLKELEIFKEKYGHCMVPEKWDENVTLGAWVSNLRSLYKKRMVTQQQRQLQHVGEEMRENNDVAASKIGKQKQRWNRRTLLKSSSHNLRKKRQRLPRFSHLDENRIQLLEEMGFVWSSIDRKWFEMLEWAKVYGVVNHAMKLHGAERVGGDVDPAVANNTIPTDWKDQCNNYNLTRIHDNYLQFVQNIQNQSLLPSFHPQDRVLELLSEETFAQSNLKEPPQWQMTSSLPHTDALDVSISSSVDYRIRRNDALHQPLRIWMINQRSSYNRLDHSTNHQTREELSTMSAQRQKALEAIYFPWSGRFRSRVEELQHEQKVLTSMERQRARERRNEQKVRNEQERVERLTSSIVASISLGNNNGMVELAETDIMTLWGEEDDEDDDDDNNW